MDVEYWEEPGFMSRGIDSKAGPAAYGPPSTPWIMQSQKPRQEALQVGAVNQWF